MRRVGEGGGALVKPNMSMHKLKPKYFRVIRPPLPPLQKKTKYFGLKMRHFFHEVVAALNCGEIKLSLMFEYIKNVSESVSVCPILHRVMH